MAAGDLVVLDFGGVYGGYCVDLTRTVVLGTPTDEAVRVHGAVAEALTDDPEMLVALDELVNAVF